METLQSLSLEICLLVSLAVVASFVYYKQWKPLLTV
jgi:hypothetical protein